MRAHGEATEGRTARVLCPVNVRREDERSTLGNRDSMLLVELPLDVDDPVQRLKLITERTAALKQDSVADGVEAVADLLGGLPPLVMLGLTALPGPPNTIANMVCTNVPGPLIPLYSVGHRLIAHYPMVPIAWSMGIGCAVTSYDQSLYFGLVADRQAAPDVDVLREGMELAWMKLRTTAGQKTVGLTQEAARRSAWRWRRDQEGSRTGSGWTGTFPGPPSLRDSDKTLCVVTHDETQTRVRVRFDRILKDAAVSLAS